MVIGFRSASGRADAYLQPWYTGAALVYEWGGRQWSDYVVTMFQGTFKGMADYTQVGRRIRMDNTDGVELVTSWTGFCVVQCCARDCGMHMASLARLSAALARGNRGIVLHN